MEGFQAPSGKRELVNSQIPKDYDPSPSSIPELDYLELGQPELRYNSDPNPPLPVEAPNPPTGIYSSSLPNNTSTGYVPAPPLLSPFYAPTSQVYTSLDTRTRLTPSSSTSLMGLGHSSRATTLPAPYTSSTRSRYLGSVPSYSNRDHNRFAGVSRRIPLSPTSHHSISGYSPAIMDSTQYGSNRSQSVPPLEATTSLGRLTDATSQQQIDVDIHGSIDKGFFLADGQWTCYRRNYFSCTCYFTLMPYYQNMMTRFTPSGSATVYDVFGYAMKISAMVSDSENHTIELVQHTPKRDKGPVVVPEKVELNPKQGQQGPGHFGGLYTHGASAGGMYEGYAQAQAQGVLPVEHTFERIQFKQATANNGKRRAAQQYYHVLIELWAHVCEVGRGAPDDWVRVAYRKSAKMIVRGRSPGHYQNERRGSTSSGPGGSGPSMGGYSGSQMIDYPGGGAAMMPGAGYGGGGYDHRGGYAGSTRHHDMSLDPAVDTSGNYHYYSGPIYDGHDPAEGIPLFAHKQDQSAPLAPLSGIIDPLVHSRVKNEGESTLPRLAFPGPAWFDKNSYNAMESKRSSVGYYPTATVLSQST